MKIINTNYNISGNILTKIVLISDIHYHSKQNLKILELVFENIKKINPNFICIPGDIIDEYNVEDEDVLIRWLKKLTKISIVIMSLGNHEYYFKKSDGIFKLNKNLLNKISKINNLYFLDGTNVTIGNINFIGLTLPIEYYMYGEKSSDFKEQLKLIKFDEKYYNVLLCHSPVNINKENIPENLNINLVLCGHMHGGIMPMFLRKIVKNRGLIDPRMRLFPKNVYGHLKINKTDVIITSGITVISNINKFRFLRNLFVSEIVTVDINQS